MCGLLFFFDRSCEAGIAGASSSIGITILLPNQQNSPRLLPEEGQVRYSLVSVLGEHVTKSTDLLQGTVDLLILKVLSLEPMHGWAIAQRVQQLSKDVLRLNQGALYPALHRLEHQAWIESAWGESENNRRAKYYSLTKAGRRRLQAEEQSWERLSTAVQGVLDAV